ncbi:hypothetical protein [Ideonella sp.]|uniref:hypothetical protein n=1 Tax=Ideonella sp. TaxID=1929293 RepID=UPI003BB4C5AF
MRQITLAALAASLSALLLGAMHVFSHPQSPAPSKETLAKVEGLVLQRAAPCEGGKRRPNVFTLTVRVEGTWQDFQFLCDEAIRTRAVGGTQIQLLLQGNVRPEHSRVRHIWAANIDGQQVVTYEQTLALHNERPLRTFKFELLLFAVFTLIFHGALYVARLGLASHRRTSLTTE